MRARTLAATLTILAGCGAAARLAGFGGGRVRAYVDGRAVAGDPRDAARPRVVWRAECG